MGRRLTLIMTFAVLGGFAVIILMNIAAVFGVIPARYISPNDVRGMAVEHNKKLYTLNFAQQTEAIDIFNRSIPVTLDKVEPRKSNSKNIPEIEKIVIYRFNAPDIEIRPIAYVKKSQALLNTVEENSISMVFSSSAWNPGGLLEEAASDNFTKLLLTTYDP